ncbi:hypothetical protein H6F75_26025 [Nodosilinea sp. FACHB-131]|uniref:hypothetical protein n=1 Tax=Cyanophyceae TaxID=3028117 RepID=UPI0016854589|nr:hypothetical protein [Nodosilinea sp. FACHB-131]MBD1876947.1 hypothetical protein [Nodosilinea sp. FACHB-131]
MSFLNHSYDFLDSVYITSQGKGGLVQGIRQDPAANQWLYQLNTTGDRWWAEDELTTACPQCLSPIRFAAPNCKSCGFHFINS